jgi:hypothetical protein
MKRYQFNLRKMFVWTTGLGLLCAFPLAGLGVLMIAALFGIAIAAVLSVGFLFSVMGLSIAPRKSKHGGGDE